MAITALEQWSTTAASNVDLNSIPIDGAVTTPSQVDNLFRELMAQVAVQIGEMNFEGADIASAATTNLATATGWSLDITGTTTITAFGTVNAGHLFILRLVDTLTLTHNATSLILPGAANIATAAGDVAWMKSEGSGNWRCVHYMRAAGVATVGPASSTDNAVARYNGTTGAIQNSGVTIDDSNNLTASATITAGTNFASSSTSVHLGPASAGIVALRPNGTGSSSGQTTIDSSGNAVVAGSITSSGGVFNGASGQALFGVVGTVALRPNGTGSAVGQFTVESSGNATASGSITAGNSLIATSSCQAGTYSGSGASNGVFIGSTPAINSSTTSTGNVTHHGFANPNGGVGSIVTNGSATAYNTASDETQKDFIGPYSPEEAIRIIRADPVRDFRWKVDGSYAVGWGAQTSYAISNDLATPGHGALGDGDFRPWGIDQSKRTPYLWAALTAALDMIEDLKTRVAALES
jgi:hypothetical protein